ncbi:hypothetical protein H4R35_000644 [Dimargaris xerosporica]|nr:hypothetical protein H4R35_000644 [Dimargaris xerosporica]
MEKLMLAAIPINELTAGAVNSKASLPAYVRTISVDTLREIQESVFQTILSITGLHHEVRQELIAGIRKHITDPQVSFVTAALFSGALLPAQQTNCLYLFGWLPLVTALPATVKNVVTDDATLRWLQAFQPVTSTKYPSITLGGKLHVTRLVADLCDKVAMSAAVPVKTEHGIDKVSCHLVLSELYFSVRRYKCSLRAFTTALSCQPWSEAHPYFKDAANWDDCYLLPATSACSLLHEPFLSVLISQFGKTIDYTTMFPLLDKVFASARPLNQYPWHLIYDSNLLEYIIHYMNRNHHEPLAQELSTHISRISALQAPSAVWYANPCFRQRLANYLCSAIEPLTH